MRQKIKWHKQGTLVDLRDDHFLGSGGEGSVWAKDEHVYKIYHKTKDAIPLQKIKELSSLSTYNNIVIPLDALENTKHDIIGYVMDEVKESSPLAQIFTTGAQTRLNITGKQILELIEKIKDTIKHIHEKDIIMGDGNEFNYLVDKTYSIPYFIDVDSYQTKTYPCKVIMPSIRDWHAKDIFCEMSDWFAFAIVSFQLFIGMHPFKGGHPNYKKNDFESRMKDNISVLNKNVTMPPAARDFSLIPKEYFEWYERMFEKGERVMPPGIVTQIILKPQIIKIIASKNLVITSHFVMKENIENASFVNNLLVTQTKNTVTIVSRTQENHSSNGKIFYKNGRYYIAEKIDKNKLSIKEVGTDEELCDMTGSNVSFLDDLFIINERLYIKFLNTIFEMDIKEIGNRRIPVISNDWAVRKSLMSFQDILIENNLGTYCVYIFYKEAHCSIVNIKELNEYRIIDAKYSDRFIILTGYIHGKYDRIYISFENNYKDYKIEIEENITLYDVNFVKLANGVVVLLTGDDEIYVFHYKDISHRKVISNCKLDPRFKLFSDGSKVFAFSNLSKEIIKIEMK